MHERCVNPLRFHIPYNPPVLYISDLVLGGPTPDLDLGFAQASTDTDMRSSSPSSQQAMPVPTLKKFAEFAQTVAPANRDDILKIANILAGDRFMATTIARVARIDRGDIMEVIKQVNPVAIDRWVTEIEDYLEIKFVAAFTTPLRSRAPMPSRGIGKSRPPRFVKHQGNPEETLGERLARTHELDRVTLPVTMGSYIRLEKGKMTKRHLRKLMRDVRSCQSPQPVSVPAQRAAYSRAASCATPAHARADFRVDRREVRLRQRRHPVLPQDRQPRARALGHGLRAKPREDAGRRARPGHHHQEPVRERPPFQRAVYLPQRPRLAHQPVR